MSLEKGISSIVDEVTQHDVANSVKKLRALSGFVAVQNATESSMKPSFDHADVFSR
jgi:hypothetical protein